MNADLTDWHGYLNDFLIIAPEFYKVIRVNPPDLLSSASDFLL